MKDLVKTKMFSTKEEKRELLAVLLMGAFITLIMYWAFPMVAAAGGNAAGVTSMVNAIKQIVTILCSVVGAIFLILGLVKLGIAQSEQDGPAQQKAIMMIATAVLLEVLAFLIIPNLNVESWIKTS